MSNRTPRNNETRAIKARKVTWQRPSALPDPEQQDGVSYRWVRTATLGEADNKNVSSRFREGWTPVKAEDHPEMHVMPDVDSRFEGNVEVGGLLLCRNSTENVEARVEHQQMQTDQAMEAVDNNYMRENDSRMPMLRPERNSRTTDFGK